MTKTELVYTISKVSTHSDDVRTSDVNLLTLFKDLSFLNYKFSQIYKNKYSKRN